MFGKSKLRRTGVFQYFQVKPEKRYRGIVLIVELQYATEPKFKTSILLPDAII